MSDHSSQEIRATSKAIKKKSKYPVDVEAEQKFNQLKRKYANAIAYLLVKNVPRKELQHYFEANDENSRRFATIKRLRAEIIECRPKAKVWIDKPFYCKIDLGIPVIPAEGEGLPYVKITLGECVFKQPTSVVTNKQELEQYMETIAKIIDAEKVWADPDMADFDIGERDYVGGEIKKQVAVAASE